MSAHVDSGCRCLLAHGDNEPQCIKCAVCKDWIRPEDMGSGCLGPEVPVLDEDDVLSGDYGRRLRRNVRETLDRMTWKAINKSARALWDKP